MEFVMQINEVANRFVWGPPGMILLVGTGIYLTFLLGLPQLRYFFPAIVEVFSFREKGEADKSISSFAAMVTAMAATVGTGNVAGVAIALHLGGPGALIWVLISAFFGMCTKFAEITLAIHYRKKDAHGDWRGGPMYVLEYGLGEWGGIWKQMGKLLAVLFALFALFASLGMGAAVQANSAAEVLFMGWDIDHLNSGFMLALLVGIVIIGGITSLSRVTVFVVPFMIVFYIVSAGILLLNHWAQIPAAIVQAVQLAFSSDLAVAGGGMAGWCVMEAIQRGVARGVFSNEAGMGSAPMAYVTADCAHPVRLGFYGIFEVFVDTFVICVITGLAILVTGTMTYYPELTGAQLVLRSFELVLGVSGKYILAISLLLFAMTTILGWYWYAETAVTYLFGVRFQSVMKLLLIVMIVMGASGAQLLDASGNDYLNNIWNISDTLIGLMAFPNMIGLLLLSLTLRRLVKDYDAQKDTQKVRDRTEKKPLSKELRELMLVSACAALLPLAIIAFNGGSRESVQAQDISLQTVVNSGCFVVGVDDTFPPLSFTDANGELVGFDIDLAREVASRLGVACEVRPIAWKDKEDELESGKIDCIGSMAVIPHSIENMSLTEAYINDNLVFVVRGDSNIMWLRDLKGKKIGMQTGSTTYDVFMESEFSKEAEAVPLMDNMAVLQQVKEGKVDVGFVDSLAAFYFIRSNSERYFILPDSLSEEDLAIAFRKEDKELCGRVQKILSEMKADGTLGKISQKWFKSDIIIVR